MIDSLYEAMYIAIASVNYVFISCPVLIARTNSESLLFASDLALSSYYSQIPDCLTDATVTFSCSPSSNSVIPV